MHRLRPDSRVFYLAQGHDGLEDCLGAAEECNAPMISICGGEPLIYPQIEALVKGLLNRSGSFTSARTRCSCARRCVNGSRVRKRPGPNLLKSKISGLLAAGLIIRKDAEAIRKGPKIRAKPTIASEPLDVLERPSRWSGADARFDRRARGRFQGMHSRDQDGEAPRLSGRHEHHDLQGDRHD